MKKIINRLLLRKKSGEIIEDSCIIFFLSIFVLVIVLKLTTYMEVARIRDNFDDTLKQYVLQMESVGYLTSDAEENLNKDLKELGIKNISIEGTRRKVGYGSTIYLKADGILNREKINKNGKHLKRENVNQNISGKISSTAKN